MKVELLSNDLVKNESVSEDLEEQEKPQKIKLLEKRKP